MVRLLVVGPGALGTVFAVRLARAGHELRIRGREGTATSGPALRATIEGPDPASAELRWEDAADPGTTPEAALLAVKAYDLETAAQGIRDLPPRPVLLIQNGLGIEARAARGLGHPEGPGPVPGLVHAVVSLPATWLGPGRVRQPGPGLVLFAASPPPESAAATDRWAGLLAGAGVPVRRALDFHREVWRKLLVNAAVNPVTADHGIENGRIAEDPWRGQALALLHEARAVAGAEGVEFTEAEAEQDLFSVVRSSAGNRSSMLQDLDRGRPTEIDAISGALLEIGARHGLSLPATARAAERIRRRTATPPGPATKG